MTEDGELARRFAEQITRTRATWARLLSLGVGEETLLSLDFSYAVPSYQQANSLKQFLANETDYELRVIASDDQWRVEGRSQSSRVTLAVLEDWVRWMSAAGIRHGALFDGWGTEVPPDAAS